LVVARDEARITRYLLRDCSDEERQQIEERIVSDDDYFEAVAAREDALIDDYVADLLSPVQRVAFERCLSESLDWQHRVEFARELVESARRGRIKVADPVGRHPAGLLGFVQSMTGNLRAAAFTAVAIVATALLAANAWLLLQTSRRLESVETTVREGMDRQGRLSGELANQQQRGESQAAALQAEQGRIAALEARLRDQPGSGANPGGRASGARSFVVSFLLQPGLQRGDSVPTLALPPDADVQLRLDLTGMQQRSRYRATLEDSAGLQVWSDYVANRAGQPLPPSISVNLSSRLFTSQQYELALWDPATSGPAGKLAGYHFIIARR
jgi:hypothetical protein